MTTFVTEFPKLETPNQNWKKMGRFTLAFAVASWAQPAVAFADPEASYCTRVAFAVAAGY